MFREYRKHPLSVADLLPWGALVAPGIVANKDGSLLAGFEYWGPDLDSATENEIAAVQRAMNQALSGLGNDWMVHADAIRTPSTTYPSGGAFPDPVTALIDEESRTAYQTSGRNFETHLFLVSTWLPPDDRESLVQHLPLDAATAAAHIGRFRTRWANNRLSILQILKEAVFPPNPATAQRDTFVNRHALAMASDADQALAEASHGAVAYGYSTPVVVLLSPDRGQLDESAAELLKLIRHRGIAARRETFAAVDAFLGTLHGNGANNVRRPLIHSQNLTHLLWPARVCTGQESYPNPLL